MSTWPQLLGEGQKVIWRWVGALLKVLEAYMGEAAYMRGRPKPLKAEWHNLHMRWANMGI